MEGPDVPYVSGALPRAERPGAVKGERERAGHCPSLKETWGWLVGRPPHKSSLMFLPEMLYAVCPQFHSRKREKKTKEAWLLSKISLSLCPRSLHQLSIRVQIYPWAPLPHSLQCATCNVDLKRLGPDGPMKCVSLKEDRLIEWYTCSDNTKGFTIWSNIM